MAERLFGVETEYAVSGFRADGGVVDRRGLLEQLMARARERLIHLPDVNGHGMFLANGSRLYIDCGLHPEFATPECTDPWDLVSYVAAGDRILAGLLDAVKRDGLADTVLGFRSNVDYGGTHSTWGFHESHLYQSDPGRFPDQLIPHLISRVIYSGAGGFNSHAAGIAFTLSPRAQHIGSVITDDSTYNRGIYHTKDEPLGDEGCHRLHVLYGESLCSQTALWLKVGATALVVAMTEAGLKPGEGVMPESAFSAMRIFASDPECKAKVALVDGREETAIGIQRHYLRLAEAHALESWMPGWAPEVCIRWREILDRLEAGPGAAATTLDWAIKRALYMDRVRRRGFTWESLPKWNLILETMAAGLRRVGLEGRAVVVDFALSPEGPIPEEAGRIRDLLKQKGLDRSALPGVLALRRELFEIDTRFGQLGGNGIFDSLDRQGLLSHRVRSAEDVERAMEHPPLRSRARLRGEAVRRFAGPPEQYVCDWDGVWDLQSHRVMDLGDPLANQEVWRPVSEGDSSESSFDDEDVPPFRVRLRDLLVSLRRRTAGAQAVRR